MTEVQVRQPCPTCEGTGVGVDHALEVIYRKAYYFMDDYAKKHALHHHSPTWWDAYTNWWITHYPGYVTKRTSKYGTDPYFHIDESTHPCPDCEGTCTITHWIPLSELPMLLVKDVTESST